MPRHAAYVPHGVIPAVLLPFHDDLSIDEKSFRSHLRDVAAVKGLSAITINAHSTEVASCTFDEQRRVLDIAQDEIGGRLPIVNGIWADGSLEAARIARMANDGGASALLVFPPAPFTLQQSPEMALAPFERNNRFQPRTVWSVICVPPPGKPKRQRPKSSTILPPNPPAPPAPPLPPTARLRMKLVFVERSTLLL